ncbi:hypothetical protein PR048_017938, partial [Dryococelus australis]
MKITYAYELTLGSPPRSELFSWTFAAYFIVFMAICLSPPAFINFAEFLIQRCFTKFPGASTDEDSVFKLKRRNVTLKWKLSGIFGVKKLHALTLTLRFSKCWSVETSLSKIKRVKTLSLSIMSGSTVIALAMVSVYLGISIELDQ